MPHIDYHNTVINTLSSMTHSTGSLDQVVLRRLLMLAPAYLIIDNTIKSEGGLGRWSAGFHRLVEVLLALDKTNQLEIETMNEASKACSECWSVTGTYKGLPESGREVVRAIGARLKSILDDDGVRYRGQKIYAP